MEGGGEVVAVEGVGTLGYPAIIDASGGDAKLFVAATKTECRVLFAQTGDMPCWKNNR